MGSTKRHTPMPAWKRYSYALLIVFATIALKLSFQYELAYYSPLLFFAFVTLFCAWFFDLGPGILVATICSVSAIYFMANDREGEFIVSNVITLLFRILELIGVLWMVWYIKRQGTSQKRWSQAQKEISGALEKLEECACGTLDHTGAILSWNRGAHRIYEYEEGEIEGRNWTCLFCTEDIRNNLPDQILKLVRKNGSWTGEIRRVRKNGSQFWGLMMVTWLESGSFFTFVQDITPRKMLEQRLEKWQLTFEQGAWAVTVCDNADIMTNVNTAFAEMHGYKPEELVGKPMSMVYAPEFTAESKKCVVEACRNGSLTCESVHITKNGTRFPVRSHLTSFKDVHGKALYYAAIHQDITQERRIQRELRRAEEARDQRHKEAVEASARYQHEQDVFLATLAHELRNPLQPIGTVLHMAKETEKGIDFTQLDMVSRNFYTIQRLVDDIMDVSRLQSGKLQIQPEQVDICEIIVQMIEQNRSVIREKNHRLYKTLPDNPIYVHGDPARLYQIFNNLLTNAAKYTDAGGEIWISAIKIDGEVEIRVKDTGIGIEADMLPRVFDLFTQSEHALTRARGGLGLGLTLVKKLVELHSGTITATSEGLGKGSCFTVKFPVSAVTAPTPKPVPVKDFDALADRKVLVVDDNVDAAVSLQMMLAMDGCEAVVAHDGVEALELFDSFNPDLVLLDIGLPKLDGREVARRIRLKNRSVVLIAVSGYGTPGDLIASKEAGIDHHVVKPVEPNGFKQLISNALDKRGRNIHVGLHD